MTTSQFIDLLVKLANSSLTRTQLLAITNIAQNEILDHDSPLTRLRPDPVLPTTDGTYAYTLDAATIAAISTDGRLARRARKVYVRGDNLNNYNYSNNPPMYRTDGGVNAVGMAMYDAHASLQESPEPINSSAYFPTVRFDEDDNPGTTTDVFSLELYMWPLQLTSESVQITIPAAHQGRVLQSRVMMTIEQAEYGRSDYWEERYWKYLKEFNSSMDRNLTSDRADMQFRDF